MGFIGLTSGAPVNRGVQVYAPRGLPAPTKRTAQRKPLKQQTAKPVSVRGGASQQAGGADDLWTKVMSDPGVQQKQQQQMQKQAKDQAYDHADFWGKLGTVAGDVLQPLDYLNYPRRLIETGIVNLQEMLSRNPKDWGHIFNDPAKIRDGRSNWDLIQGKTGKTGAGPLGFGNMVVDIPSGPNIPLIPNAVPFLPAVSFKPGQALDRAIGIGGDIGLDPFTHGASTASQVVNPLARATEAASRAGSVGDSAVADLQKLLAGGGATEQDIAQGVTRTQQALSAQDKAAGIAAETAPGTKRIPLPRSRTARAAFIADVKATQPEVFAQFQDELLKGGTRGFQNMSKEAKDALGITRNGIGLRAGMLGLDHSSPVLRIPGTETLGNIGARAVGGLRQVTAAAPFASHWRDPEGLSTALDTLTRSKPGDVDAAAARIAWENESRLGTGMMRQQGGTQVRQFAKDVLKPLRKQGKEAVRAAMREAETTGHTPLNKIFADVLDTYSKVSGQAIDPEFLLSQDTYLPHKLVQPFKRFLKANMQQDSVKAFLNQSGFMEEDLLGQAQSIANKRSFLPGETYDIGGRQITLTDGSIDDLNEQLRKAFPEYKGPKFYEDDPAILLESYVTSRAKQAGAQRGFNTLASNPAYADQIKRISGPLYDELVARNSALQRDPLIDLVSKPYDQAATAQYAQDYLGAGRGPTDEALVGPRQPETPTRFANDRRTDLPNQWVDPENSVFRSVPSEGLTSERNQQLTKLGDDYAQKVNDAAVVPDWRQQARAGQKATMKEARQGIRDLRQNVMQGLRRQPNIDRGPIQEVSRLIKNAKQSVRTWTLKADGTTAELERVMNESAVDIGNLQDELNRTVDDAGQLITDSSAKVRKDLESKLRQLKDLQKQAQEKLDTAPTRMRQEARARSAALNEPIVAARKKVRAAEEEAFASGPGRIKLKNAQSVMEAKAGSTYEVDAARLAELDGQDLTGLSAAEKKAINTEKRALKSKFTHRGEHGAEGRARKVLDEATAARSRVEDKIRGAQSQLDQAIAEAQTRHEAVVVGAEQPVMSLPDVPTPFQLADEAGNPLTERPQISGPVAPDVPGMVDESSGFGVGEERVILPRGQETQSAQQAAEESERARRINQATGDTLPVQGRTEADVVKALYDEAGIVERGGTTPLRDHIDEINQTLAHTNQRLEPGVISQAPEVIAAKQAFDEAVAQGADTFEAGVSYRQAIEEQVAKQDAAAKTGVDQRIAQVTDLETKRADLQAKREYHMVERRKVQAELAQMGKGARASKYANLSELSKVYDDLELIGWANPQITDGAMAQTEMMLNDMADKLRSAEASAMTASHVRGIVNAAYRGKLGPVMRSTVASGWHMLHDDALGMGDIIVKDELSRQMKNLYKIVDDPTPLGRAFSAMTNLFKTYATLSPGFHVRNALSAIFMNTADGVSLAHQAEGALLWTKMAKTRDPAWWGSQPAEVRQAFEAVVGSGAGGRFGETGFAEAENLGRKTWNKLNSNAATKLSQHAGQWVEGGVRMGMALDTVRNGGTVSDALERISRVHFDYSQISKFDAKARQFIPFWTYYSRNLPLQIQMMWTQPRAYSQFQSVMSAAPPKDEYTPDYWNVPGNWNTGNKVPGGELYGNLDLPFTRSSQQIQDVADLLKLQPKGLMAQLNPLIASPAEFLTNSDFFTGQQFDRQNPKDYNKVSGPLGVPINMLAKLTGQQDAAGRTYEPFTNAIQSVFPMIDRSAKLTPAVLDTGSSGKEPPWAARARFLGLPIRVLTQQAKDAERARRYYDQKDQFAMQRAIQQYLAQQQAN